MLPTGREAVYKGLVTLEEKILLVNMTPVHMKIFMNMVKKCNIVRAWCPLGAQVPVNAPVVVKGSHHHGGCKSRGVFATEMIPKNTIVGEYRGTVQFLPTSHLFETRTSCYVLDAGLVSEEVNYYLVADKTQYSAWTRFINRPNSNEVANVTFDTYKVSIDHPKVLAEFCVLVQTVQDITKGEQLLVLYDCIRC